MVNDEITQKELNRDLATAANYLKENGVKLATIERVKRVSEELFKKNLTKPIILSIMIKEIPKENFNEKEIDEKFGNETIQMAKTIQQMEGIVDRNYGKLPSETISSIVISLSSDFQPIIAKIAEIADTLFVQDKIIYEKDYAKKAEDVWWPLATKLGLSDYEWKISDRSFKVLNPDGFEKVKKLINKSREEREALVEEVKLEIEQLLKNKIETVIVGRPKSFKSIFEKLKKVPFQKMHDIYGIRIICNKEKECYEALGYVHSKYEIIPEAFDDYISRPKNTGYKSIHTAVKRGKDVIEIQIRTWEQHLRTVGENYWEYKKVRKDAEFEKELSWERQLIEWQRKMGKDGLNKKATGKKIFVFTPKNDAIPLPLGATVIDFAFAVHTDIGKKVEKAKLNGNFVPIETKLNNLDKVEIIVSEKIQMKKTWLNFAQTDKAKTKIKNAFGLKATKQKRQTCVQITNLKRIKMAECCHPLPGEDVIGVKTTKRKIVVHKKDCPNIAKLTKDKLLCIGFERERGKTEIRVKAIDRPGMLSEILNTIKESGVTLTNTNFKIKKSGYAEAIFGLEVGNVAKLDKLIEKIESIPSVQAVERI
jgi:GTP pyrophosphokinase